ncbi:hypothetical protein DUI87_19335 [Hirundo rustica rustica]|uniref:ribonuclease H n=1 Tax=Hirundo rustica rustica TaxID=333673 RepID=A0A3M0JSU5_HIRRU|nr:hypothetical protein DUI87_19335 [Hirundo rustica rustica]
MHIPEYSQIVSPLYLVTCKKNDFYWGPEQQQAFAQIKQEIVHAVALGPVRTGPDVKNVLYSAAGNNGLSWSLWQKVPGETRGRPLGFWSRSYRGSEANYTPTEKEILAAYEGVQAASEVVGTETQLLLAPRLPVLGWMFKAEVLSTHHATNATWSKWIALITQRARIGNPNRPGILEIIRNCPEGENFGLMDEEEQEQVTRAEEAPPYNQLPAEETRYALFTDGSCRIIGMNRKWKAAVWSPTRQVAQATEGEGGSSQLAELKAFQLALDIAEREKWPKLYLYTDSWMVANALWGWLEKWKKANWQRRGKPIWAADEWKDIATRVEKLPVKVRHVNAHVPKSRANEEHQNNEQVDQAAKIEVSKIDLDWQHKGELFLTRWAHDASGHQGRDATYKWARDRGVDLTMDSISQVIHDCETCAAIKQAKRVKPLWYGGRWSKYKYGEAWQIDYITLPQTRQGKHYVLTMVEATTGWLETYPVPHATARNTILGLEKQVLWRHGTPERIESDNGTHFKNSLINNWAREHGIEWVYHIPYHAPASGKIERYNGLLKTTLKALGGGSFKNWEQHLAKATWLVNTRGSTNRAGPAQSESLHTVDGEKVPVVHDNIEVVNEEIKIKLCPLRVEDEEKINSEVWYTPDSVGRLNIPPFSVIIKDPETLIRVKQYPISPEGKNGLKPEIERLLSKGLLESCMSPFNTPILPIKKADGSYRLVHDLREINKRTVARFPVVANPYTLLSRLGPEKQYYSVIDLKDAFWACPLDEKSRDYFAFEWEDPVTHRRQQLRWTVLPQGFTESPNLFGQALEQILQEYQTGEGVTLIQYVDDLLIAGETEDKVRAESIRLLNFLSAKGLKVSKAKLQFVEEEVKYLRHYLRKGEKKIDPERVKGILSIPPPKSKKQIRQLLGLMGYCRQWIENYSTKVKFLYEKLSQGGLVKWDEKDYKHLKALQHDLVNAPVLSLPDLKRPFYLFVNTDSGTAYGVLTQEWAGKKKPVGYLSKLLDPVSRGWPTCLQALVACALLVEEANKITFNGELRVLSPHNIRGILQQKAEKWITDARLLKYEGILLDSPKLTLEVTALQNPAQFLYGRPSEDGLAHECLSTIEEQTKIRPDLDEEELEEGDRLFVDGSSRVINGKRVSGYAIVGGEGLAVIESGPLSGSWSAQACELYAVLRALQLLKDKSAEIVDCTCRTRLKGIRCDTPPVKYRNWDSYVKRQQSRPRGPPEEYPCCREDGTPVARGNRVDGKGRGCINSFLEYLGSEMGSPIRINVIHKAISGDYMFK